MLQNIRDKIQGWFAGVVIALIAVGFIFWGLEYYIGQGSDDKKTVAKVDGEKITEQDLMQTYRQLQQRQQAANGGVELTPQMQQQLKQYALQGMISRMVMIQAARKAGFRTSKAQVEMLITQVPEFQVNGQFSRQRFEQMVYANFGTISRFFDVMKTNLVLDQLQSGILQSAFILPNEWQQAYALYKQTRDFGYYVLPTARFTVNVTEQDMKEYYQQNQSKFKTPLKVKVSYILLSPKALEQNVVVTDAQIEQFYQTNKMNFSVPKSWQIQTVTMPLPQNASQDEVNAATAKLNALRADLVSGKTTWAELAKNKVFITSKTTVTQDKLSGVMATVLPELKEKAISQVVRMPSGLAMISVNKIDLAGIKPLAQVKDNIKKRIVQQQIGAKFATLSNELSNLTFTNPTTLEPAAKSMKMKVVTSDFITKQGSAKGILADKKVLSAVFSKEVLDQGNNSYPISLKDGSVIVVRVDKKQDPHVLSFAQVSAKIQKQLQESRSQSQAGLVAYKIQQAIASGESKEKIMQQFKVNYVSHANITAQNKEIPVTVLREVFELKSSQDKKQPATAAVLLTNGDYAIIQLLGVKLADPAKATATEQKLLQQEMQNYNARVEYEFLAKSAMDNAKIKNYLSEE